MLTYVGLIHQPKAHYCESAVQLLSLVEEVLSVRPDLLVEDPVYGPGVGAARDGGAQDQNGDVEICRNIFKEDEL